MSENVAIYSTKADDPGLPTDLEGFKYLGASKPYSDEQYVNPSPQQVTRLIQLANWSQEDVSLIVGVAFDEQKGSSSTVGRWQMLEKGRKIPYAAWRLLLINAGVVSR